MNALPANPGRIIVNTQRGSAMFLGLMILIVLTLLGVFASSSGIMQERMAGNFRDSTRAFESAESGTRWIEAWFASITDPSQQPFWCESGSCTTNDTVWQVGQHPNDIANRDQVWWDSNAMEFGINPGTGLFETTNAGVSQSPDLSEIASDPRMVIEHVYCRGDTLADCPGGNAIQFYRITSRATGGLDNNVAIVESTFARRYE